MYTPYTLHTNSLTSRARHEWAPLYFTRVLLLHKPPRTDEKEKKEKKMSVNAFPGITHPAYKQSHSSHNLQNPQLLTLPDPIALAKPGRCQRTYPNNIKPYTPPISPPCPPKTIPPLLPWPSFSAPHHFPPSSPTSSNQCSASTKSPLKISSSNGNHTASSSGTKQTSRSPLTSSATLNGMRSRCWRPR